MDHPVGATNVLTMQSEVNLHERDRRTIDIRRRAARAMLECAWRIPDMKEPMPVPRDLTHTILRVLFICLLMGSTFWILRPFLISMVWGTIIVVATWPVMQWLHAHLPKSRKLAILLMTAGLLSLVLVPLMLAVLTIARNAEHITSQIKSFDFFALSTPPAWLAKVPFAGDKISEKWTAFAALSSDERVAFLAPYAEKVLRWFVARAGTTGMTIVNFILTMIVSIILYAKGEIFRAGLFRFARRLGGQQGEDVIVLAGKAMRGVVMGVVVTALTQAAVGGLGLFIAGVPAAALLTAVMVIFCLAQLGPLLVMIPAVIWLYWSGQPVWGTVLIIFAIIAGTVDNILRPYLIKRGVDLPLLLIFAGVIGGLFAFGVIGLFIAPVILAVAYTLLSAWVSEEARQKDEEPAVHPS
jgi:predicted PurR-regulated permease PerM